MSEEAERYERLHATTDVTVWAKEFCQLFNVGAHSDGDAVKPTSDQEGLMIGWFANYAQACNDALQKREAHAGTWYAFIHFFHMDHANAAMHTGQVRYSPITFRLAEFIYEQYPMAMHVETEFPIYLRQDARLNMVLSAKGAYEEDKGR